MTELGEKPPLSCVVVMSHWATLAQDGTDACIEIDDSCNIRGNTMTKGNYLTCFQQVCRVQFQSVNLGLLTHCGQLTQLTELECKCSFTWQWLGLYWGTMEGGLMTCSSYAHSRARVTQGFLVYWEPQQRWGQGMWKRLLLGASILLAESQRIVVKWN